MKLSEMIQELQDMMQRHGDENVTICISATDGHATVLDIDDIDHPEYHGDVRMCHHTTMEKIKNTFEFINMSPHVLKAAKYVHSKINEEMFNEKSDIIFEKASPPYTRESYSFHFRGTGIGVRIGFQENDVVFEASVMDDAGKRDARTLSYSDPDFPNGLIKHIHDLYNWAYPKEPAATLT